ncbi:MAG: carbonic anhydrase family protein [Candidatus Thiodiazotropha sp.]
MTKNNSLLAMAISAALLAVSPLMASENAHEKDYSTSVSKDYSTAPASHGGGGHGGSWGYQGSTGPSHWGDLGKEFRLCKDGLMQSPIDFNHAFNAGRINLDLNYQAAQLEIENNGHTVKVSYPEGSYLSFSGQRYKLLQFHFHSPSEHTEAGGFHPMEIHFVHQADDGTLAVIGVFVDEGEENLALSEIWDHLPNHANNKQKFNKEVINAYDLIPKDVGYYRYMGSLTTPPCSEGVNWFVINQPIQASKAQIDAFKAVMEGNNRPTQPVNHRLVVDLL